MLHDLTIMHFIPYQRPSSIIIMIIAPLTLREIASRKLIDVETLTSLFF